MHGSQTPATLMRVPAGHGRQAVPLEVKPMLQAKGQEVALTPTPTYDEFDGAVTHGEQVVEPAADHSPTKHLEQKWSSEE